MNTIAFVYIGEKRIYENIDHHKKFYDYLKTHNIDYKIYEFYGRCNVWPDSKQCNGLNQVTNYYLIEDKIEEKFIIKMRIDLWLCKSSFKILLDNINFLINGEKKFIGLSCPPPHSSLAQQLGGHRKDFYYEENFKMCTEFGDPNWGKKFDHNYEILINSQKPWDLGPCPSLSIGDFILMFDKTIINSKEYMFDQFKKYSTGRDIPTKWLRLPNGRPANSVRRYGGGVLIWHAICKKDIIHYDIYCNISTVRGQATNDGSGMYLHIYPKRLDKQIPVLNITFREYFKNYFEADKNDSDL